MTYKIRVYHSYYGCETGCCGHRFDITDKNGIGRSRFEFAHFAPEDALALAQKYVRESWPGCYDSIDWSTIEVAECTEDCDP